MVRKKNKSIRRKNKFIITILFTFWAFILIFNGFTQLLSNWFNIGFGTFILIGSIGLIGSTIYALWLSSGGKI